MGTRYQDPPIRPRGSGYHVLRRTLHVFAPYTRRLIIAALGIGFTGFTIAMMPLFTRYVIDHVVTPKRDFPVAILVMAGFIVLMLLRMATWYLGQSHALWTRERVIFELRSSVFARLQELCLRFHERYSPGYLYDRTLGGASTSIGVFMSMFFNNVVHNTFTLVAAVVVCLWLHPLLAICVLAMSSSYVFSYRYFALRIHDLTKVFNLQSNEFAGQVMDLLRGVKTVKAFAMEQRVISEFDERLWPLQLRSLDLNKETIRLSYISETLGYLISATIVVGGAYLAIGERISTGTLVAFIAYQTMVIGVLNNLAAVGGAYGAALAGLEQIYEVLDEHPSVVERRGAVMPREVRGQLDLVDVHFTYDGTPVLQGVTLRVPPGQSVALVGPSGAGKSTLINLLLRFYDPTSGCLRLDGRNIRDLPITGYRSLFGVVLQDPFLFNDTIYHNLLSVAPQATDDQIRAALERAQAWEFTCALKDGWHHQVGESGTQLSGGQRQRIALARCFLTDPRFLILDEATSALDTQSELLVQRALHEIMQGRNVFIIAHRLSTVRNVDRILVLQDGRIIQDGAYTELCAMPGLFRDLHLATLHASLADTPGVATDVGPDVSTAREGERA